MFREWWPKAGNSGWNPCDFRALHPQH